MSAAGALVSHLGETRSSSPLEDDLLVGTIIIEDLPDKIFKPSDMYGWLKQHGEITDVTLYEDAAIVHFETDLEAACAVQCKDGAKFYGSCVSMRHAEPGDLSSVRKYSKFVERYTVPNRKKKDVDKWDDETGETDRRLSPPATNTVKCEEMDVAQQPRSGERDRCWERVLERERERERYRDRRRSRDRDQDREWDRECARSGRRERERTPSDDQHSTRSSSRERRYGRDERRKRNRPHSPLNHSNGRSPSPSTSRRHGSSKSSAPPYLVAIIATQHEVVPYAEMIEKQVSSLLFSTTPRTTCSSLTHIVVLLSHNHLAPCLSDLTRDGVPFALACSTTNWSLSSCTLRILYVPTQQEHRNMPLADALSLLQTEYVSYTSTQKPSLDIKPTEDDTFLAPNRNVSTLLRMLADSRILSIGELDEIAVFVQERKRRLEGKLNEKTTVPTGDPTGDLKSRIFNMLYPQDPSKNSSAALQSQKPSSSSNLDSRTLPIASKLAENLGNPVVQQALDTLMTFPKGVNSRQANSSRDGNRYSVPKPSVYSASYTEQYQAGGSRADFRKAGRPSDKYPSGQIYPPIKQAKNIGLLDGDFIYAPEKSASDMTVRGEGILGSSAPVKNLMDVPAGPPGTKFGTQWLPGRNYIQETKNYAGYQTTGQQPVVPASSYSNYCAGATNARWETSGQASYPHPSYAYPTRQTPDQHY